MKVAQLRKAFERQAARHVRAQIYVKTCPECRHYFAPAHPNRVFCPNCEGQPLKVHGTRFGGHIQDPRFLLRLYGIEGF